MKKEPTSLFNGQKSREEIVNEQISKFLNKIKNRKAIKKNHLVSLVVLKSILDNSISLLSEAKLLSDSDFSARAAFLKLSAIEEFIKAATAFDKIYKLNFTSWGNLEEELNLISKELYNHKTKFNVIEDGVLKVINWFFKRTRISKDQKTFSPKELSSIEEALKEALKDGFLTKALVEIRKKSLYCDLSIKPNLISSPLLDLEIKEIEKAIELSIRKDLFNSIFPDEFVDLLNELGKGSFSDFSLLDSELDQLEKEEFKKNNDENLKKFSTNSLETLKNQKKEAS